MSKCNARQYSDQMMCECGLAWDMNDPDPPACPRKDMTTNERDAQDAVRLEASQRGVRLFRNNVGAVTTDDGRHIRFGLANESKRMNDSLKSGDLIGITPVTITLDMVGRTFGVFTSVEVKRSNWNPLSTDKRTAAQRKWQSLIRSLGGIAIFSKGSMTDDY